VKASIHQKLDTLRERFEELEGLLSEAEVIANQDQYRSLSQEYSRLAPVIRLFARFNKLTENIAAAEEMAADSDAEIRAMGQEELQQLASSSGLLEIELQKSLLPTDPHDDSNVFLEVRAGTGGDEAAIFAGDLFRMYSRYAESRGWNIEILSARE
jgi:peptide chain release factor 1